MCAPQIVFLRAFLLVWCAAVLCPAQTIPEAPPASYTLQRGDTIEIRVFDLPELTQTTVIRPDGQISAPLAGNIVAAGRTPVALSRELATEYGKRFRNPQVTVSVLGFSNQTVYIGGEVNQPGAVPLAGGLSLTAAIFRSGGFKDSSKPEAVILIHPEQNSKNLQKEVNVTAILNGSSMDLPLQPGDIVFVPKSTMNVYVGGEVAQPGLQTVQGKMTLLSAVVKAGGTLKTASVKEILLIRDSGEAGKPEVTKISLEAVLRDPTMDKTLKPFDVIYVSRSTIAKIDQFVDDYLRKTVPIMLSGGFSYLLNGAVVQGK